MDLFHRRHSVGIGIMPARVPDVGLIHHVIPFTAGKVMVVARGKIRVRLV